MIPAFGISVSSVSQTVLHSEFPASQGYIVREILSQKQNKIKLMPLLSYTGHNKVQIKGHYHWSVGVENCDVRNAPGPDL